MEETFRIHQHASPQAAKWNDGELFVKYGTELIVIGLSSLQYYDSGSNY